MNKHADILEGLKLHRVNESVDTVGDVILSGFKDSRLKKYPTHELLDGVYAYVLNLTDSEWRGIVNLYAPEFITARSSGWPKVLFDWKDNKPAMSEYDIFAQELVDSCNTHLSTVSKIVNSMVSSPSGKRIYKSSISSNDLS